MAITPYLYYKDVGAALKWLAKAFGFKPYGARNVGSDRQIRHAAMQLGDDIVMMGRPGPRYKNPKRLGQATQCLHVTVDDVDTLFARARKAGATVLEEPAVTPYGQRRCGVEDPEGHQWYFAQVPTAKRRRPPAARSRR